MTARRITFAVLAGLVLATHVALITVGIARAAVWLGGAAAAALAAALVGLHLTGLHLTGLLRLASRRRRPHPSPDPTR